MCGMSEKSLWRKYKAGLHKGRSWALESERPEFKSYQDH